MSTDAIQVLYDMPMQVGESPLWHQDEGALYWIDIPARTIHRHHPASSAHNAWQLPSEPGCIALSAKGGLIVAMRSGIALFDTTTGAITDVVDAPYDTTRMRFNDGRCDAAGRLWVGTMYEPRDQQLGSVFCLEKGKLYDKGIPATVSNGLAFGADGRTLYHADTTAHRISVYDFDCTTATISNGRSFAQFSTDKSSDYGGRPDGAAVDSEGAYWIAMFEGGRLLRFAPTGEVLREVVLPVHCPTMVAFGGFDLRTLYVTSARHNRSGAELLEYPYSGCVLALTVDVPGRTEPPYQP